jgi:hypothetical protein
VEVALALTILGALAVVAANNNTQNSETAVPSPEDQKGGAGHPGSDPDLDPTLDPTAIFAAVAISVEGTENGEEVIAAAMPVRTEMDGSILAEPWLIHIGSGSQAGSKDLEPEMLADGRLPMVEPLRVSMEEQVQCYL